MTVQRQVMTARRVGPQAAACRVLRDDGDHSPHSAHLADDALPHHWVRFPLRRALGVNDRGVDLAAKMDLGLDVSNLSNGT